MAKQAFRVDNGIQPSENNVGDLGANTKRFLNAYVGNDVDIDGDVDVGGTLTGGNIEGGGGGGGTDIPTVVAYATALAY